MIDDDESLLKAMAETSKHRNNGDYDNTMPIVEVKIPDTVVIDCPKARGHLSKSCQCVLCDNFRGVAQIAYSDESEIPWCNKYSIVCAYPSERKCKQVGL